LGCRAVEDNGDFRDAFRELAKRYHPDRVGPGGTPFLRNIVEAYRVLSDYERRNHYDLGLRHADEFTDGNPVLLHPGPDETLLNPTLPVAARFLHDPQITWSSLELVRERMLCNFLRAQPPKDIQAEALDAQLMLTPEEAAAGGTTMISAPAYYPCSLCRGSGRQDQGAPCSICDERGLIAETETVRITVPAMVGDHQQVEIPLRALGVHNFYLRIHFRVALRL
jgi:molecular chaperone DnaJ/curved DNA-binding protein